MMEVGEFLGKYNLTRTLTRAMFATPETVDSKMLEQKIHNITFKNPIGLSGGFDKNGILTDIIPAVDFGHMEIGSVTAKPYEGNPGQRLWRLKKSKGLVVNYGLKSLGAEAVSENLQKKLKEKSFTIPIGINIAKTNCPETNEVLETGVADYEETYKKFLDIGSFFTINISCPNVAGGQPFHKSEWLEKLLNKLEETPTKKPIFLKISSDLTHKEIDIIYEVASRHHVDGFVCTNLTKKRDLKEILDENVPTIGGISGKVVEPLANDLISYIYAKNLKNDTKKKFTIIGVGGIFSAQDAYTKIRAGATLLQLITGMIFEGPQLISEINLGLIDLLKKDGFKHISEAIGADMA